MSLASIVISPICTLSVSAVSVCLDVDLFGGRCGVGLWVFLACVVCVFGL